MSKLRSRKRRSLSNSHKDNKVNIAFCFLLYETVEHDSAWQEFFDEDIHGTSNIYSHIKINNSKTPAWVSQNKVQTVPTSWCGEGITHAFNQMLISALANKKNKYFCLLSGSDIPLRTYPVTYKRVCSTDRSRIYYMKYADNVFDGIDNVYNAHNWVILNRKCAKDYIRLSDTSDKRAQKFIQKFRQLYKDHGVDLYEGKNAVVNPNSTWIGSCPDEVYPINWLVELYGKSLNKYVKKTQPTYSKWDFVKDPLHPEIFNIKSVKKAKTDICSSSHLFARKFTNDASDYIAMRCGGKYRGKTRCKGNPIVRKELVGRLANQMFEYASAMGIAHRKGGKACIITDPNIIQYDELRKQGDDMIDVFKGPFDVCKRKSEKNHVYDIIPEIGYGRYDIKQFVSKRTLNSCIEIKTDMDEGFLQSYKYFEPIATQIRHLFTFKDHITQRVEPYVTQMWKQHSHIVGIHIRRGDQIDLGTLTFPSVSYFNNARKYFIDKYHRVKFIVATNDRKWVNENLVRSDTELITYSKDASEDMAILSQCTDGMIMSIGTFSFFCAWLANGPTVYYKHEFNMKNPDNRGKVRVVDYYLPHWIGLE